MKGKRRSKRTGSRGAGEGAGTPAPAAPGTGRPAGPEQGSSAAPPGVAFWLMLWLSGFACLTYQILWMRQAGLLFGSTSQAAALTLAIFFGGLASGAWFWGRRCRQTLRPLLTYARLEFAIAASGVLVLLAPVLVRQVYPVLGQEDGHAGSLLAFKIIATLLLVFPASFLMGGTLPVLGQAVIRTRRSFGALTARMYAVNTMGAACGAFATAFVLIWLLGLRLTCVTAMGVSAAAGLLALRLAGGSRFASPVSAALEHDEPGEAPPGKQVMARPILVALAFVSGFNLLAMEVAWTRMLAQVHENSVYSFATVLIVVLVCLSLGAGLAARLARGSLSPPQVLRWLLVLGGTALALTPLLVTSLTRGLTMLDTDHSFGGYVLRLFVTGFAAIGPACLPLGAVFPFLMKGEERFMTDAGHSIGILAALNTIGAILGALAAGFLLLGSLGLWVTVQLVAAVYLVVAIALPSGSTPGAHAARMVSCFLLVLLFTLLAPSRLPDPSEAGPGVAVVEKWEGSDGTVSVVGDLQRSLSIRINANYSLGSTDAYGPQIFQARIPLLAWPDTDSVFFLGMGTGITAGEALSRGDFPQVRRVVAAELSPNVVAASRKYFTGRVGGFDLTNGLYEDPRAEVVIGDGRNHLLAHPERYAMIIADLFLPYRRGSGNLYSREHFEIVRKRLETGGVFVQWLPLYQMTEREFGIIGRTMIEVFPQVSLWRGNFQPGAEIAAMVGHADHTPIPACTLDAGPEKWRAVAGASHVDMQALMLPLNPQTITIFYGGNLSSAAELFERYPLNTDDRPVIEFGTPRSLHKPAGADRPQFLETRFAKLVDQVQERTPPSEDPLLSLRSPANRHLPLAGSAFHRGWIARVHGNEETWQREWESFLSYWLDMRPGNGRAD